MNGSAKRIIFESRPLSPVQIRQASPDYSPAPGGGAGDAGEQQPEGLAWMMRAEVQADIGNGVVVQLADPAADLDDPQTERIELQPGRMGGHEPAAQGVQQPEGGGVQQQAEGVGPEAVVREAVG